MMTLTPYLASVSDFLKASRPPQTTLRHGFTARADSDKGVTIISGHPRTVLSASASSKSFTSITETEPSDLESSTTPSGSQAMPAGTVSTSQSRRRRNCGKLLTLILLPFPSNRKTTLRLVSSTARLSTCPNFKSSVLDMRSLKRVSSSGRGLPGGTV